MKDAQIAVIGAGWAGCSAAVELARRGVRVTLFEAARIPGGRARRVEHEGRTLDNGQHILLGAYRDTLHMMRLVGVDPARAMLRLPLQMRYPPGSDGMDFIAPRLPAPFHLMLAVVRAKGLSTADKLSLARFSTAARWMDWQLYNDCSVTELLDPFDQTERLVQLMWRPLCIAALNTPPERASARVFLRVLGDSLGAARSASDMLLPTEDLSALFPDAAIAYLEKHHGRYQAGARVRSLQTENHHWTLDVDGEDQPAASFARVIIASPAPVAQSLLAPHDSTLAASLQFAHEPITTCYLQYPASMRLAQPFYALPDQPADHQWGQFVFDRGWLDEAPNDPGYVDMAQLTGMEMDGREFEQILPLIEKARHDGYWLVLAGHEINRGGNQTTRTSLLEKLLPYANDPANRIWLAPVGTVAKYVREKRKK